MNVYPLFSSVVSATILDTEHELIDIDYVENTFDFISTEGFDNASSFATKNLQVLDYLPDLKEKIFRTFTKFKNEILCYKDTDFVFTTSWFTKTLSNGYSQFHNHKNCMYSGVLYFDSYQTGDLLFKNMQESSFKINNPTEYNIYNFETFYIKPQKNLIIFFPSNLQHKVDLYKGIQPRYSLAFNLHPVGHIGVADSSVNIKII